MSDYELDDIRSDIAAVTMARLGALPGYGIYLPRRTPYRNRIITLVHAPDRSPVAFSTVMYYSVAVEGRVYPVFQLGLVVAARRSPRRFVGPAYFYPLAWLLALRGFRQYWVASASMIPNLVGVFADGFVDVFPHYRVGRPPSPIARAIARRLVQDHGDEFGAGPDSRLDESTFAVSNCYVGPAAPLRKTWDEVAKHPDPRCNELCRRTLDYQRGDDLLQIGRVNLALLLRYTFARPSHRG